MRVLRTELFRSSTVWVVLPVTVGWIWLTMSHSIMWLGSWPAATTYATATVLYAAVPLGACVALDAARRRAKSPATAVRLSRHGWLAPALQLAAGIVLSLVPMVVALIAVAVRNAGAAPPGHLWPGYTAYAVSLLIIAVCVSHLVGYASPSVPIGGLAGAAVTFLLMSYAGIPLGGPPNQTMGVKAIVLGAVVAAVAVTLAVTLPAGLVRTTRGRTRTWWQGAAGASAVAVALSVVLSPVVRYVQVYRPAPENPVCSRTDPRVCLWPEHATYLPLLTPVATRISAAADGLFEVPSTFWQEGLLDADADAAGLTFSWLALDAGLWHAAEGMTNVILNTSNAKQQCWPTTDEGWTRLRDLTGQVQYWLTARGYDAGRPGDYHGTFDDVTTAKQALGLDETSQREWVRKQLSGIESIPCELDDE